MGHLGSLAKMLDPRSPRVKTVSPKMSASHFETVPKMAILSHLYRRWIAGIDSEPLRR